MSFSHFSFPHFNEMFVYIRPSHRYNQASHITFYSKSTNFLYTNTPSINSRVIFHSVYYTLILTICLKSVPYSDIPDDTLGGQLPGAGRILFPFGASVVL